MDIPSLFMIPSAVSSGKVHSVFPNSTDADFDFNRDSSATRVNSQGLIETVGYFGSELITNGNFSSASDWTITNNTGTATEIINGYVRIKTDGAYTQIEQTNVTTAAKTYKLQYTVLQSDGGDLGLLVTGNTTVSIPNTVGTHIYYFVAHSTSFIFKRRLGALDIKIDNVSVKEVTGDRARLNYEIEGGLVNSKPSLLLEPQSTNLIANSNLQSGWFTLSGGTIVLNEAVSPEGIKNASLVRGNGISSDAPYISMSVTSGTSYAFSVFAKAKGISLFRLIGFSAEAGGAATFDLSNGTISISASDDFSNAKIEDFGNGWYRCSVIATADGTGSALFGFSSSVNTSGDNFYVYGAQFEQQSYPTSLIPTNGSTQTRAAETCNGAGTSSMLPSEEGILYIDMTGLADDGTARTFSINNTVSNRVFIQLRSATGQVNSGVVVSGSLQGSSLSHNISQTSNIKAAFRYKSSDYKFYVNGSQVASQSSGNTFSAGTLNDISFDSGDGAEDFYGKIRDIRVYNTKEMTDSEVDILLTKITS